MNQKMMDLVEKKYMKREIPEFHVGDTVDVHTVIKEGAKERVQIFNGVVIAHRGRGMNEMMTVRRIVNNEGVERVFPLHSPLVANIEIKRRGKVRRAKLYYLRDRVGKARRLRELRVTKKKDDRTSANHKGEPAAAGMTMEPVGSTS
jgi:large subunit ribosomal protein L19